MRWPSPTTSAQLLVMWLPALAACSPPLPAPAPRSAPTSRTSPALPPAPSPAPAPPSPPAPAPPSLPASLLRAAEAVAAAYVNRSPAWSPDGRRLLHLSNREGRFAAYASSWTELDLPADRIDSSEDEAGSATFSPDNLSAVLRVRRRQNQPWTLCRIDLATGQKSRLGPEGPLDFGPPRFASARRDKAAFTGVDPSAAKTTVFLQQSPEKTPVVAATLPGTWELLDLSPNASRALFRTSPPDTLPRFVDLELASARSRELALPEDGLPAFVDGAYDHASATLWIAGRGAHGEGCLFQLASPSTAPKTAYCVADSTLVRDVRVSPRGDLLALTVVKPNHAEIHFVDSARLTRISVAQLPAGTGRVEGFSTSRKTAEITWETASSPPDIVEIDPRHGRPKQLRLDVRPTLALFDEMSVRTSTLEREDGSAMHVNVYAPASALRRRAARVPTVVLVRTAPFVPRLRWSPLVRLLVARGFAVVEPWGPQASERARLGTCQDWAMEVERARRWAGAQPWGDPDRIGLLETAPVQSMVLALLQDAPQNWRAAATVNVPSLDGSSAESLGLQPARTDICPTRGNKGGLAPTLLEISELPELPGTAIAPNVVALARVVAFLESRLAPAP